jgi:hypothetical protein
MLIVQHMLIGNVKLILKQQYFFTVYIIASFYMNIIISNF